MKELVYNTLKFNGLAKERPKTHNLFSYRSSHKYECRNCNNKIHQDVMRDFVQAMPDNKLCCPFCMSLDITEVLK